ncbi:MAG: RNA-binding S4 domain-containing protein [Saprospiraceae bacterium]|nr:RNA-binding S4 domain-containing protein [Saprospiraceae bacterium]
MSEKLRIDKWLWSVRIYKSRTLATEACKEGKVKLNGLIAKPAQVVQENDQIGVRKNGFDLQFQVLKLIHTRVGAPIAQTCYADITPEEERNKYNVWYIGKSGVERRDKGAGRPTKKDRRVIDEFKTDYYDDVE